MIEAKVPENEIERLRALDRYQLLDTPEEALYDRFAEIAARMFGTAISHVTLVDERRQWHKATYGGSSEESAREFAFCNHVVASNKTLIVSDATVDERFHDNPLVSGAPFVRFYAGAPLITPEGHTIGTLCLIDPNVRTMSAYEQGVLESLAGALMSALDARRHVLELFDSAKIDLISVDPATGKIRFGSAGACRHLDYPLKELIDLKIGDVAPALAGVKFDQVVARLRREPLAILDTHLLRRDGERWAVELRLELEEQDGDEQITVIAIDRTESKAASREIDLLMRAVNATADSVLVYRVQPDGSIRLHYTNDAYLKQTGYTRDEVLGCPLDMFRLGMADDEGMTKLRAALRDGHGAQAQVVSYRKDGSSYWNDVTLHPIVDDGRITHWVSIERDVTEEVAQASAMAEEQGRLLALSRAARRMFALFDDRKLVATVKDVLAELLRADVRVLAANANGDAVEVDCLEIDIDDRGKPDALVFSALQKRGHVVDEAKRIAVVESARYGNVHYTLEVAVAPGQELRETDLVVLDLVAEYFAVAARNVALYRELDDRRNAVLELNQTKSDLIAMLAHDFRGPLTSIVGFSDLIAEIGPVNDDQREFLDTMKRSALNLADLAKDTLTLSRLERNEVVVNVEEVDLDALIRSIAAELRDRRTIEFESAGSTRVLADPDRLRQVFTNLLDNAIKYSPGGAPPVVKIAGEEADVRVTVTDSGIGIPFNELRTVFDRFSRATNARKAGIPGTGFGLFLSKRLVELHGGSIAVSSIEGQGTTFTVVLPRNPAGALPPTVVLLDPVRDESFLAYGLRDGNYRVRAASRVEDISTILDTETVAAIVVNAPPGAVSSAQAAHLHAIASQRKVPIVAVASDLAPLLGASATVPEPVLAADVLAALERVRQSATRNSLA